MVSPKIPTKLFLRISALASKMRSNKKIRALYTIGGFYFYSHTTLFLFDLFFEARAEILKKFSLVFWEKRCLHKIISVFTDLYKLSMCLLTHIARNGKTMQTVMSLCEFPCPLTYNMKETVTHTYLLPRYTKSFLSFSLSESSGSFRRVS